MSEHVALNVLLERNPGKELVVDVDRPISVLCAGVPWICTAVLERTAILVSGSDPNERHPVRHENLMVDPDGVEWRDARAERTIGGKRTRSPWTASQNAPRSTDGKKQRDLSDDRARKNQAEVAATDKRELEVQLAASRAEAVTSDAFYAPAIHKRDDLDPTVPTERSEFDDSFEAAELRSLKERDPILKFCPGCKEQKPKSDFPTGKGYFKCDECRASGRRSDATSAYKESVHRNQELSAENKKHCPACDTDKPLEAFNRNSTKGDGLQAICRQCQSDRWTAGATAVRTQKAGVTTTSAVEIPPPMSHSALDEVAASEPVAAESLVKNQAAKPRRNGRPPLTFTELLNDLRQLSAYALGLEQDNATLRTENDQLRDEQAGLYDELHAIVGGIKKATAKGGR